MMRCFSLPLILLSLAAPVAAQDTLTAESLLQAFTDRCTTIAADPEAAVSATIQSGEGGGAITTDNALLQLTTTIEIPGASFATLFYTRIIMPADRGETCAVTISFDEPGGAVAPPDLIEVVGAKSADLLGGPTTRHGSDLFTDGEIARSYIWSVGDSVNDASLFATQTSTYVLLTLNRRPAAN
jgi:hypothetical protein